MYAVVFAFMVLWSIHIQPQCPCLALFMPVWAQPGSRSRQSWAQINPSPGDPLSPRACICYRVKQIFGEHPGEQPGAQARQEHSVKQEVVGNAGVAEGIVVLGSPAFTPCPAPGDDHSWVESFAPTVNPDVESFTPSCEPSDGVQTRLWFLQPAALPKVMGQAPTRVHVWISSSFKS